MLRKLFNWVSEGFTLEPPQSETLLTGDGWDNVVAPLPLPNTGLAFTRETPERFAAQRGLLRRISQVPGGEQFLLRGSFALREWLPDEARCPNDLDFVTLDDLDSAADVLDAAVNVRMDDSLRFLHARPRWELYEYSDAPGMNFGVSCWVGPRFIQLGVDVSEGETINPPPILLRIRGESEDDSYAFPAATPEQSLAWKLRWLLEDDFQRVIDESGEYADEFTVTSTHTTDLFDAGLLASRMPMDRKRFHLAIRETFFDAGIEIARLTEFGDVELTIPTIGEEPYCRFEVNGELREVSARESMRRLAQSLPSLLAGLVWLPTGDEAGFIRQIE